MKHSVHGHLNAKKSWAPRAQAQVSLTPIPCWLSLGKLSSVPQELHGQGSQVSLQKKQLSVWHPSNTGMDMDQASKGSGTQLQG